MKTSRADWMLVVLGIFACTSAERDYESDDTGNPSGGSDAAGGADGNAGGSDGATGGGDGETGGTSGTQGDAGASGVDVIPPVLTSTELADAKFNTAYSAELALEGTGPFQFEITEGELPSGLELDQDGNLTGTPIEDGEFEFTLTVSNSAGEDSATFSLFVSRKPWFVYLGDDEVEGQKILYAVDTSTALLTKHVVSENLPTTASVSAFEFAASGNRLAYTADVTTNDLLDLYVVDVSQDALGDAVKLDTGGLPVGHFALTPSGDGIAYQVMTEPDVWELRFQDLTDLEADFIPIGSSMAAEPWYRVTWVTEDRLVYSTSSANATRLRSGDTFGAEEPLEAGTVTRYLEREHAVVSSGFGICSAVNWLYDFKDGVVGHRVPPTSTNFAVFSPDLAQTTLSDNAGGLFVYDAKATDGEPLGLISPAGFCADVWWSPNSDRLVTTGYNVEYLQLTNVVDGELETHQIEGDYTFNGTPGVRFVGNDRVVFTTSTAVFEFQVEDGEPTEPSVLVAPDDEASSINGLMVSGNQKWAFYALYLLDNAGETSLLVDLTAEAPVTPRVVRPPFSSLSVSGSKFSPDSSALAIKQLDANTGSETLYLTNLLHPTAPGTKINFGGCQTTWCPTVPEFQFQP